MRENQRIFAILHIEQKDEAIALRCRWLDDLTLADEAMIQASDLVYDRAKAQIQRDRQIPKKETKVSAPKPEKAETLELGFDISSTRHSHILKLKELFERHRGPSPVTITFHKEGAPLACLNIDSRWGVKISPDLKAALSHLSGPVA